jgi:hypothetical protein
MNAELEKWVEENTVRSRGIKVVTVQDLRALFDGKVLVPVEPASIEPFGTVTVGDSFDGHSGDENGGSIHTAGINVGEWGNRIEIYGAGKDASTEAEVLRDIIIKALTASQETK